MDIVGSEYRRTAMLDVIADKHRVIRHAPHRLHRGLFKALRRGAVAFGLLHVEDEFLRQRSWNGGMVSMPARFC